jgi:hypothetical protein
MLNSPDLRVVQSNITDPMVPNERGLPGRGKKSHKPDGNDASSFDMPYHWGILKGASKWEVGKDAKSQREGKIFQKKETAR